MVLADANEAMKSIPNTLCGCNGYSSIRCNKPRDERVREAVWRTFGTHRVVLRKLMSSVGQHVNEGTDFVLKTYYTASSYHRVKEAFHTKFPNNATSLNTSRLINYQVICLWLFVIVRSWVCES